MILFLTSAPATASPPAATLGVYPSSGEKSKLSSGPRNLSKILGRMVMASASSTTSNLSRTAQPIAPVVSVVMPTWNGERFLRPAIESILNQTFRDLELIIIDDGSTDSTPRILADFKDKDKDGHLIVL